MLNLTNIFSSIFYLLILSPSFCATTSISKPDIHSANFKESNQPRYAKRWRRTSNSNKISKQLDKEIPSNSVSVDHITSFVGQCDMPTIQGKFKMRSYHYTSLTQKLEPIVMICGDIIGKENVLVRVHDQCFTSEVFGSLRCDCREQLQESLKLIQKDGGIVIYLQQEGRGIGAANKVAAYSLQDQGEDTVDANKILGFQDDLREYKSVPDILKDLDIKSIKLMTNNPYKIDELTKLGVVITERVSIQIQSNFYNQKYLRTKRDRMNHFLSDHTLSFNKEAPAIEINEDSILNLDNKNVNGINCQNEENNEHLHKTEENNETLDIYSSVQSEKVQTNEIDKDLTVENFKIEDENSIIHNNLNNNNNINNVELPVIDNSNSKQSSLCANSDTNSHNIENNALNSSYVFGRESVEKAIAAIKNGEIIIVVDDADRENEGDFIMAAEKATPEAIGFIVRHSSGVICVSLESERLDELALPPMVISNEDPKQTAYSISVDCNIDTTTGISAYDRAKTFRKLADPSATKFHFYRPGHVFPLRYKKGGVLARAGHTEASLDLSRLAGLFPAGVLAEVVNDDGSMKRLQDLEIMANEKSLVLTSVQDIIAYRLETNS